MFERRQNKAGISLRRNRKRERMRRKILYKEAWTRDGYENRERHIDLSSSLQLACTESQELVQGDHSVAVAIKHLEQLSTGGDITHLA